MEVEIQSKKYRNSLTQYSRFKTRVVHIGEVPLGGDYPIRTQSMTTTDTMDTKATVEQSIRIIEAGADYVRITAPSLKEAVNLENIKKELRSCGYNTPLIADIHFTPNAAEHAARVVEKIRVNPGNYADRKRFKTFQYTDRMYESELERIRKKFAPLVKVCKEYGAAMRIGTNHGSLSDRIMNRYGDTPLGMVESALEFVRICEDLGYYEIVLSMKASNPKVMVQAYRLLVNKMQEEGMNYPLHLGVTEAGDGIDGRVKSAVGIGTLLEEGIGDTIRVSLTEEPEAEIPVALKLAKPYNLQISNTEPQNRNFKYRTSNTEPQISNVELKNSNFERRITNSVGNIGSHNVPVVILSFESEKNHPVPEELQSIGYIYDKKTDKWKISDTAPDYIYLDKSGIQYKLPGSLRKIFSENNEEFISGNIKFIKLRTDESFNSVLYDAGSVIILDITNAALRSAEANLMFQNSSIPVILYRKYENLTGEELLLRASVDFGKLLLDGFGDGIWLDYQPSDRAFSSNDKSRTLTLELINKISFAILQATRTRISKTEYIACPSCGRTQFDLQETTQMIRARTSHLKGIKIAIMGCIVNGPGEMADADYGFVGSGPGWVTLYRGKDVIERGIPYNKALGKLIDLMKYDGVWINPA